MRTQYFALNERPICAKCRPQFAKMIARGVGAAAMRRAAGALGSFTRFPRWMWRNIEVP